MPGKNRWVGANFQELIRLAEEEEELNRLLTITQVAKILQVSHATVRRLLRIGALPFIDITSKGELSSKAQRVALDDLNQFIENRRRIWTEDEVARISRNSRPLKVGGYAGLLAQYHMQKDKEDQLSSEQESPSTETPS